MKLYINCLDNDTTYNKKNYLLLAAKRLGIDYVVDYNGGENLEYVLNIEPYETFVTGSKWTGIWAIDALLNQDKLHNDWIYATDVFIAITTKRYPIEGNRHLLFQACDPELHKRFYDPKLSKSENEPKYDFILCGTTGLNIYEERERCIAVLKAAGFTYMDFGKNHKQEEYVKHISKARVQFIRSMQVGEEGEIAQRFFECLAIGPVLTNYVEDLDRTGLKEGRDYLAYRSTPEMIEKMHYLIDNPEKAEEIARNGREQALLNHSYEHRLVSILNLIKENGK